MTKKNIITRRRFLWAGTTGVVGSLALAACGAPATPAPVATTAKPVAGATAAPAATIAPAAATKPAGAAPTVAAKVDPTKPGRHLIGKLEGPTLVTDPAQYPKSFKEAPMLAELVKAGKLPPVEKRLPDPGEAMVMKPVHEVGKFGGTWRRGFTGPGDGENGNRIVSTDKILFWDYTGTKVAPSVAKDWKVADDGKTITILLRKGMKWSDGAPFTANDMMFWWDDMYQNKDLIPTATAEMSINGKTGTMSKVDDYTIAFKFPEPYFLFVDVLAGSTQMGGGQATRADNLMGAIAPAHYLKQFHPKYVSAAELDKKVKDAKFDSWVSMYKNRGSWRLNPDLPTLTPWKTTSAINTPQWILERNPYYWEIDTDGNQLPYFDKIVMTLAENLEVLNLRAIAGELDYQARHIDMGKLPVYLENQQKGNYKILLEPGDYGSDMAIYINQSFDADPEIAKWLTNRDFRRALGMGFDREQLNETFWLGIGVPGSCVVGDDSPYNPGPEWRKKWSTFDQKQSNELLDKAGLDKKDGEGYRLRTDGKGRLRIEVTTVAGSFMPYTQMMEMIREQWKKIGVQIDITEQERSLWTRRVEANEHQVSVWANDGTDEPYLYPGHWFMSMPNSQCGPAFGRWLQTNGRLGKEPKDPQIKKVYDLFNSAFGKPRPEREKIGQEIWKIVVDEQWIIGVAGLSPAVMGVRLAKNDLGNIPTRQVNGQHVRTEGISHPATFYWKK